MTTWVKLEPMDHQAAIGGKVVNALTGRPIAGVRVEITDMPAAFEQWLSIRKLSSAKWNSLSERPDRTNTSPDGVFHFVDLPDGAYTLSFEHLSSGPRLGKAQRAFTVNRNNEGRISLSLVTIPLMPTGARGKIVDATNVPVCLARVRATGSDEDTHSGPDGSYALTMLEPGARSLVISAPGFTSFTTHVTLTMGAMSDIGNIVLQNSGT